VRPVSLGSLRGEVASAQRQVSFLRLTSFPVYTQGDNWLSQVPVLPLGRMPCSWTPVVLLALALSRHKLLPSLTGDWVGFPTLPSVVIPLDHYLLHFGALSHGLFPHYTRLRTHHC
jgi:hypothetical protein